MNSGVLQLDQEMFIFGKNEQALIPVFTAVFCFTQAEHNLIKLELNYIIIDHHKLLTVFWSVLYVKFKETNQFRPTLKISESINSE